jgi:hypothetical protein
MWTLKIPGRGSNYILLLFQNTFRLGYHYTMMVTAAWPILLLVSFSKTHGVLREAAESDIQQNLYYRTLYIIFSVSSPRDKRFCLF